MMIPAKSQTMARMMAFLGEIERVAMVVATSAALTVAPFTMQTPIDMMMMTIRIGFETIAGRMAARLKSTFPCHLPVTPDVHSRNKRNQSHCTELPRHWLQLSERNRSTSAPCNLDLGA